MKDVEYRKKIKEFIERWTNKGYEKGESQKFWIDLLETLFEIKNASSFIEFEDTVHIDKATGFIDAFIPSTKVLIEQKSIDKDLRKAIKQSDGSLLNPFQQAKRYSAELPYDNRPRWIVTCNFKSFLVYDMNNPNSEPEEIFLKDLNKEYYRLEFLVNSKSDHIKKEEELSFQAGELVGKLYDAFSKQYKDLSQESSQKSLNELCVRLVFCLYAEDADLFGRKNAFHDFLNKYDDLNLMRKALIDLFKILDTPLKERDPYLEDELNQFPYVNGGLFSNENIEIPSFTEEIKSILLAKASDDFDWSEISPTIFGAVFESTLNPETRRSGGMHYTSIENIHKVIDPLFLDDLRIKLNEAEAYKNEKTRNEALRSFQDYISNLTFFDPACGSGNFLTETYLSLRRLENEAIETISHGQIMLDVENIIKVNINQFYGIEINDFAVTVAKTALWIAESQMLKKTEEIVHTNIEFLPLKTYDNIHEGNALLLDWNEVIQNNKCNYIMGNPPFVGYSHQSKEQKSDLNKVLRIDDKTINNIGKSDYVIGWYYKASHYMVSTKIRCALVSTNSISQGEQPLILWKPLFKKFPINIIFAYKNFKWSSESKDSANVNCVIIGFTFDEVDSKYLYLNNGSTIKKVNNINPYLLDAENIFIEKRSKPLFDVPEMTNGNRPTDNGNLIVERENLEELKSSLGKYNYIIKRFVGSREFLHNEDRYCLWIQNKDLQFINKNKYVRDRLERCKKFRLNSSKEGTRKSADTPWLFQEIRQPINNYIALPVTTSESRRYIPIGYLKPDIICSNALMIIPNADLYHFGILMSNVHMSWMRAFTGRLEMRYQYSAGIVYNNFPFPNVNKEQKKKIESTAKLILDARKKYSNSSLADLYDELTMPPELRKAHQLNDLAVWEAYGKKWDKKSESDCVAWLMKLYEEKIKE